MLQIFNNLKELNFQPDDVFLHFTGNIFGIGCSAFSEKAIQKIIQLKQRDGTKGFIVLFSSLEQAKQYSFPDLAQPKIYSFLNQYYPANLTALLRTEDKRFALLAPDNIIALRVPKTKLLRDFINHLGFPILSTSINLSGEPYCSELSIIQQQYETWFDFGLYDSTEPSEEAKPSTIINFVQEEHLQIKLLREGSIPFTELEESWEKPLIQFVCIANMCRSPIAEYYVRKRFEGEKLHFRTGSSGLSPKPGRISSYSRQILESYGIHVGDRPVVFLNDQIVRQSLYLLCMASDIKHHLLEQYPDVASKTFTFAEFTKNALEIENPYGLEYEAYIRVWDTVKQYTEELIRKLKELDLQ